MKKKLLSALLAAGMLFTMAPAVAMAEPAQQTSESQIVNSSSEMTSSEVVTKDGVDVVKINKSIAGTDTENEFEITLDVETTENLKEIPQKADAAVVLVIDNSTSMNQLSGNEKPGKENETRMDAAKAAAKSFLDSFSQASGSKRMVSIVCFGTDSTRKLAWCDVTDPANLATAKSAIDGIYAPKDNGTNIEAGLQLAWNQISQSEANSAISDIENKNIVLLTDGMPTYYFKRGWQYRETPALPDNNRNNVEGIAGEEWTTDKWGLPQYQDYIAGNGGTTTNKTRAAALAVSDKIRSSTEYPTTLYSIACDLGSDESTQKFMKDLSDFTYSATSTTLSDVFQVIANRIIIGAKAWKVTDPMADNIQFKEITSGADRNTASYNNDESTLVWDLKSSIPSVTSEGGTTRYTYTLKYKITLNPLKMTENQVVATNKDTYLEYYLISDESDSKLHTVFFDVPTVKAFFGSLSFTKTDPKGNPLSGATFTLEGTATGSGKTVTLTATSGEKGTVSFGKIPAGTYTLTETKWPEGYKRCDPYNVTVSYGQTTVTRNGAEVDLSQNVVDDYEDDPITISGKKSWEDNDNQDNKRPQSVTIRLIKNGVDTDETTTASADSNWEYSFSGLAPYDGNTKNNYTIQEETVEDYSTLIDNINYNVTNSYTPETTSYTVTKSWDDNNNQDGKRPGSVTVQLCKTVTEDDLTKEVPIEGKTLTLSADNGWTGTFDNLAVYEDGQPITYTVQETVVPDGYKSKVSLNPETHTFTVTNTHTPETVDISGSKTWDDGDNQDNIRPDSITIRLLADEAPYAFQSVTEENQWTWSFENLPKYKNGQEIRYTITEDAVEGYVAEVNDYNVTNTHIPATVDINVAKSWNDDGDRDGKRPNSVEIQLYRTLTKDDSAEEYDVAVDGKTLTLNESNGWKDTFTDLPANEAGVPIQYTVKESNVSEDYVSSVDKIEDGSFVITNSYTPESITVCGSKTWDDQNNKDGVRPACIVIRLYADGEQVAVQNVTEKEQWSWNFGSLPKYRDGGVEIKYTIAEDAVEGYTATVNGYDVTNTHTVKPTATPAPTAAPTARPDDPAPTATPTPAPAVAQTSDNSHPMLWVALLVVAAIGMTGVVVLKKRQNNK